MNIFKITPVPSIINTVQSMEPSKPKAPPFIRLASGRWSVNMLSPNLFPLTSYPKTGPCIQFQNQCNAIGKQRLRVYI